MPNGIQYSTGATPAGCIRKGNMLISNNTADTGTSFYTGINPPTGGYTIYLNKASGGPSIYCPANNTQLVSITNQIAGANYTTAAQCLAYFAGQSDKLCMNFNYEGIVTNGLVLNLDAGFDPSYPTAGTTWYDLSGNTNNGTLTNGPTFNSANSGSLVFDGVDDYIRIISNSSVNVNTLTWSAFVQGVYSSQPGFLFIGNDVGAAISPYKIFIGVINSGGLKLRINYNNVATVNLGNLTDNTLYNLTITYDGTTTNMYVNGTSIGTSTNMSGNLNSKTFSYIGSTAGATEFFNGKIFNTLLYSRALSATEVLQNYNAQKGRFGL